MLPPQTTPTALLVIDLQLGLTHPTAHGPPRNNPNLESNVASLLSAVRAYNSTCHDPTSTNTANGPTDTTTNSNSDGNSNNNIPITIVHIHHHSLDPTSLLHPDHIIDWSPPQSSSVNGLHGIDAMPCSQPLPPEPIIIKHVNSGFIGTDLEALLTQRHHAKQVVILGMTTEHCVSTTVRMCANLDVCGYGPGDGEGVVLVEDGCACFGKVVKIEGKGEGEGGGTNEKVLDAEMVHAVEVECLRWEFAEVVKTMDVFGLLEGS